MHFAIESGPIGVCCIAGFRQNAKINAHSCPLWAFFLWKGVQHVTIEQKKEWLYRYQNSQRRQKIILLQIEDARSRATSVQSTPGGVRVAPTGLRPDRVADSVQRIDELQRKYIAEVEQGYQIYDEIQAAIEALPDIRQTIAVHYHYLQDMKIDFICVKLDLSKSTVAKLLSTALDALEVPDAAASMPGGV